MKFLVDQISIWMVPILLVGIPLLGIIRKVKIYEVFVDGAKEGFDVGIRIIPYLVAILVAIGMFRGSGAMDLLTGILRRPLAALRFPPELFPLAIMRSLTGSGSLALATDIVRTSGPDSLHGRMAATIYGSSETTFYVLAVYFGAVGVKRTRHAIPASLIADLVAVVASVIICNQMFG
ncbi:MAG TPA: spore maturation protein [Thermoanaerobaculia bacterium]|nr:spore maturation protein [Thermoanaerobaculia bacterium]